MSTLQQVIDAIYAKTATARENGKLGGSPVTTHYRIVTQKSDCCRDNGRHVIFEGLTEAQAKKKLFGFLQDFDFEAFGESTPEKIEDVDLSKNYAHGDWSFIGAEIEE